jgi:hypothetical protein
MIDAEIIIATEFFNRTKNPAAAALAYSLARKYQRIIPEEVQAEIDRFIGCIADVAERVTMSGFGGKHRHFQEAELYAAWRNGIDNPMAAFQREHRDALICDEMAYLIERGSKVSDARAAVLDMGPGVDEESIKRIWKQGKRIGVMDRPSQ